MTYQIAICDDEEKQRAYIKRLVQLNAVSAGYFIVWKQAL